MLDSPQVTRFRSELIPAAEREALVREELWRNIYRMDMQPRDSERLRFDFHLRSLPDVYCQYSRMTSARLVRDRHLAGLADNRLALVCYLDGPVSIRSEGQQWQFRPGEAFLVFMNTAAEFEVPDSRFLCLDFDHDQLACLFQGLSLPALTRLPHSIELRMLMGYAAELMQQPEPQMSPELSALAVRQLQELAALAIRSSRDEPWQDCSKLHSTRLREAKAIIARQMQDPTFTQVKLARALAVSTRSVQSLFARIDTTFSSYLLEQRLNLAWQKLRNPLYRHLSITHIALDAGFGDLSYFNRCFRKHYGLTPSALRAESLPGKLQR